MQRCFHSSHSLCSLCSHLSHSALSTNLTRAHLAHTAREWWCSDGVLLVFSQTDCSDSLFSLVAACLLPLLSELRSSQSLSHALTHSLTAAPDAHSAAAPDTHLAAVLSVEILCSTVIWIDSQKCIPQTSQKCTPPDGLSAMRLCNSSCSCRQKEGGATAAAVAQTLSNA